MMCIDAAGMVMGWKFFDHAAHLSGILYGIFWCHIGKLHWASHCFPTEKAGRQKFSLMIARPPTNILNIGKQGEAHGMKI